MKTHSPRWFAYFRIGSLGLLMILPAGPALLAKSRIICHRGGGVGTPENTLAGIELGLQRGCDWIEVDVRLTRDRQPALLHDSNLERTTDGSGKISTFTLEELGSIDAGSRFGSRFKGERIPRLRDAINLIRGRAQLLLDLKQGEIEPVLEVVRELQGEAHVLYRAYTLRHARVILELAENPQIVLGLDSLVGSTDLKIQPSRLYFTAPLAYWDSSTVEEIRNRGSGIIIEMQDRPLSEGNLQRVLEIGPDAILTDQPKRLRERLGL